MKSLQQRGRLRDTTSHIIQGYSLIFLIFSCLIFSLNIYYGKNFIYTAHHGGDGFTQHFPALAYYGEWLRSVFHTIIHEHSLDIPMWDLSIGLGGDIITTLSYYVLGDPLNLLSVFVPMQYTEYLYNALIILRFYLAGLSFCAYGIHRNVKTPYLFLGTAIYTFSFYPVVAGMLHPYFLNPLIYMPLIFLGIDQIIEGKKGMVFFLTTALAAISNFYFFYMLTIAMFFYAIFSYLGKYGKFFQIKHMLRTVLHCTVLYLTALIMASFIFVPSALSILQSNRIGTKLSVPTFYEPLYYVKYWLAFVNASADHYSHFGYTVVALFAVFILFLKTAPKDHLLLKTAFLLSTAGLCIPFIGHIFNGFGYAINRWVWIYCFIVSLIVIKMAPEILSSGWKYYTALAASVIIFAVPTFFFRAQGNLGKYKAAAAVLLISALVLCLTLLICRFVLQKSDEHNAKYICLFSIIAFNIFLNVFGYFSPFSGNTIDDYGDLGTAYEDYMSAPLSALGRDNTNDHQQVRASMEAFQSYPNSAMLYDLNSTSFYFSTINPTVSRLLYDMELNTPTDIRFFNMDGRTALETVLGVKYCIIPMDTPPNISPLAFSRLKTLLKNMKHTKISTPFPWYIHIKISYLKTFIYHYLL